MAAVLQKSIHTILNEALEVTAIEEAFSGFLVYSDEEETAKKKVCLEHFKQFWRKIPEESRKAALDIYVAYMFTIQQSTQKYLLHLILKHSVEEKLMSAKMICDAILNNPKMTYTAVEHWTSTIQLIINIIKYIDYKGCRDLLHILLERVLQIPPSVNLAYKSEMEALKKLLAVILDRNNCLLPGYFAVTEIQKIFPDVTSVETSHWLVGELLGTYVESFRAVSRLTLVTGRCRLLPVIGHSNTNGNAWKLDAFTFTFHLKGMLPFDKDQMKPQTHLIQYVLRQPYSRDMVCTIISLNKQQKQRSVILEEQLSDLVVIAMEKSEHEDGSPQLQKKIHLLWQHLSSQLIIFALFQFVSFPEMVDLFYKKLKGRNLVKGRDHLMWLLLQFISGSIKKNPLLEFLPILKLFDLLYTETKPLPVPDYHNPTCVQNMAMACIWPHFQKKASQEKQPLQRPLPQALKLQTEFLKQTCSNHSLPLTDFRIALLCNAYSTTGDVFQIPMTILTDSFYNPNDPPVPLPGPSNNLASGPIAPLSMSLLDSLSTHAKLSFTHHIASKIMQLASSSQSVPNQRALSPAFMETYSRLLVYIEIESLGIKGFISQVFTKVVESHAWGILHSLLELFSYRLHHVQPHYRIQLLCHLHSLSTLPQTSHNQLYHCIESTALRIINSLASSEVQPQLSRFVKEPKQLLSSDSEELNRALVLTLARAMHVTGSETLSGSWLQGILEKLQANTPHNWASHTLKCFPTSLQQFFEQNGAPTENRAMLKELVNDCWRKWNLLTTDEEKITYFTGPGIPPYFLCIIWKMLLERDQIPPIVVKALEHIGPRGMSAHIRSFADYLVHEFSTSAAGAQISKCVEKLNDMLWKLNVVTLDKLVLCLALRSHEGNEAQVCFFIIQLLILKPNDFRTRVNDFVRSSPEHWTQSDWHTQHMNYHSRYPEKYFYEGLCEKAGTSFSNPQQYLPVYFSNVCLRFLPVFDILIHRTLELPPVSKSLETLLDHLGGLFKFHDRPVTYLYNTLHYYEKKLQDRPHLKRKLVDTMIGAQKTIKPAGWCLSQPYLDYLSRQPGEDISWDPPPTYYYKLLKRLVDTMNDNSPFPDFDWRFNEFPNCNTHALYVTCMELMVLPCQPAVVANNIIDVVLKSHVSLPREDIMSWINAIGLVLTSLPEVFWVVIQDHILATLKEDPHLTGQAPFGTESIKNIFAKFDFTGSFAAQSESPIAYLIALTHAVWHHSNIGQLTHIPKFLHDEVKPIVKTEGQFLLVCILIGPLLQRFNDERTRCLTAIAVEIYQMLQIVNQYCPHLVHMDTVCDFLAFLTLNLVDVPDVPPLSYHIKYMFAGDAIKTEAEEVIRTLRPELQRRLRFISRGVDVTPVHVKT